MNSFKVLKCARLVACAVLSLALLFASMPCISHAYNENAESDTVSRGIAIAYDNSGSMVTDSDKWCGAKYSLEVLASMLNTSDTMSLYTMESTGRKLSISGNQDVEQRVKSVHDSDLGVSDWTDPSAAKEAYSSLLKSGADEKYLVITTDGAFNKGGGLSDIRSVVSQCEKKGITVVYLAIGDDAEVIKANPKKDVYVKLASSESILSTMTEVANQIFGRDSLPDNALDQGSGVLHLDVPMSNIIVFAQGADVRVGDLTLADGSMLSGQQAQVKYSDRPTNSTKYDPFKIDEQLQGVVSTFGGQMPKGECKLDIEGATSVEVYYTPYVDIAVELSDKNGINYELQPGTENELSAGSYDANYTFLDPFTGEQLDSDLLYPATFGVKLESGGEVQSATEGEKLNVPLGEATIIANAQTTGGVRVSQTYEGINVQPAVTPLTVDASGVTGDLAVAAFPQVSYSVKVAKADGSEFSDAEWNALKLEVEDSTGLSWAAEKSGTKGELNIKPLYINDSSWDTQTTIFGIAGITGKQADLKLTAVSDGGDEVLRGNADVSVTYTPDLLATFAHVWPFLLGLLILLYFIYKYVTKPRLPRKMKPHLQFGDEDVPLRYSERKIQNKWSPWGPERVSFAVEPRDMSLSSYYNFPRRFKLCTIGLTAAKKRKGKRCFVIDDKTRLTMRSHRENTGDFPDPEYSGVVLPDARSVSDGNDGESIATSSKKRIKKKPPKIRQDIASTASRSISFTGLKQRRRGGRAMPEYYTLKFK